MQKMSIAGSTAPKQLSHAQREALRRRNLKPKDYVLVKESLSTWYFRNVHTGLIKMVGRGDRVR